MRVLPQMEGKKVWIFIVTSYDYISNPKGYVLFCPDSFIFSRQIFV